jgi:hypothetical protein
MYIYINIYIFFNYSDLLLVYFNLIYRILFLINYCYANTSMLFLLLELTNKIFYRKFKYALLEIFLNSTRNLINKFTIKYILKYLFS